MKFLLFAYESYSARGGMEDLHSTHPTLEAAQAQANLVAQDYVDGVVPFPYKRGNSFQILNTESLQVYKSTIPDAPDLFLQDDPEVKLEWKEIIKTQPEPTEDSCLMDLPRSTN